MGYRFLADLTLALHLCFILFVLFGGLLCLFRTGMIWFHLPAASWGVWVEWAGRTCPLTPLENHFRKLASGRGFFRWFHRTLFGPGYLSASPGHLIAMVSGGCGHFHQSHRLPFRAKQDKETLSTG